MVTPTDQIPDFVERFMAHVPRGRLNLMAAQDRARLRAWLKHFLRNWERERELGATIAGPVLEPPRHDRRP